MLARVRRRRWISRLVLLICQWTDASGEGRAIPVAKQAKDEGLCISGISEKIRKMVAVLESDTTYRDVLAKMIAIFYDAVDVGKDDLAPRMREMESRITSLEQRLAGNENAV